MRRARLLLAVLTALSPLSRSAAAQADTIGSRRGLFTYRDLVLAGSVVAVTLLARPFDDHYAARLQDSATHTLKGIVGRQRPYVRPRNPNSYWLFRGKIRAGEGYH